MVLVKKLVNSLQCIKVCSIESEFGQFFLRRNYPVQDRTSKENCLRLLSLDDLHISTKH